MSSEKALLDALRSDALVKGEVVLSSGSAAQYYVDAKRALLKAVAFRACGDLVASYAKEVGATAVGGLTMGADPVALSALTVGSDLKAFTVRKIKKEHGLQRWIEGPLLTAQDRLLVVEDVVTTGTSTLKAIERIRYERLEIVGALAVVDRLARGGEAIASVIQPAPYKSLFTIDDLYPERADD